jgi:hypothetical protein
MGVVAIVAVAFCLALFGVWLAPATMDLQTVHPLAFWNSTLGSALGYGWAAAESGLYRARMQRRARVGLGADPLIENRLLLWVVSCGASTTVSCLYVSGRLAGLTHLTPGMQVTSCLLVLSAAVANWLVFFPPRAYRRRIVAALAR